MKKINFNNIKNEISSLNPREIYNWPFWAICGVGFILFIFISILGTFLVLSDKYEEYDTAIIKEDTLRKEFSDKTKQSINLNLYKKQLVNITQASDELLKQLPNKSEVEKLLIYINQAGVSRGLKFELFKPLDEKLFEFYAELPISIKLTGTYDSLGNFAADISELSRVVLLKDIIVTTNMNTGLLMVEANAKTFRYLDQEELTEQKAIKKKLLAEKNKNKAKKD